MRQAAHAPVDAEDAGAVGRRHAGGNLDALHPRRRAGADGAPLEDDAHFARLSSGGPSVQGVEKCFCMWGVNEK